ncbi:MAG: type II toxin-antitoxin system RelE/ParE family toxin [Patescibacteria group bacterium]
MKYKVDYQTIEGLKRLKKIAKEDLREIRAAIEEKLTVAPVWFGKPLQHSLRGHRRLRVGNYRVIYRIVRDVVKIIHIAHRSVVYRDAA